MMPLAPSHHTSPLATLAIALQSGAIFTRRVFSAYICLPIHYQRMHGCDT